MSYVKYGVILACAKYWTGCNIQAFRMNCKSENRFLQVKSQFILRQKFKLFCHFEKFKSNYN